jgi:hypothetical protein
MGIIPGCRASRAAHRLLATKPPRVAGGTFRHQLSALFPPLVPRIPVCRDQAGAPDPAKSGNLLYEEERTEVVDWLTAHDWEVTAVTAQDLMARNGRFAPADLDEPTPQSVFVEGRLH